MFLDDERKVSTIYGNRLAKLRKEKNLTQEQLAKKFNLDRANYSKYENETLFIPIKYLNILCNFYEVSFDYILELSNKRIHNNSNECLNLTLSSKRLKEFRVKNNLSQRALAQKLNTTQSMIWKYENNKNFLPIIHVYAICIKFKISADYLLGKTDTPKYLD